jgi:PAS domain S-box-containing protein
LTIGVTWWFWHGMAAAMTIVLALGTALAWLLARRAEAMRESERRYERAMVASNAGLWEWDARKDRYYLSARHLELLGFPPDTVFAGREDFLRRAPFHPEDRENWTREIERVFESGGTRLAHELRVIVADEIRWVRVNAVCFRDDGGKVARLTGSVTDITERKLAEEASRASEKRYSLAMEAAEEGHFDVDLATNDLYISDRMYEIFGYPPGTRFTKQQDFMKQFPFYGGDGEKYWSVVDRAMMKGGPDHYEFEFRIARPSGEVRWLWTRAKIARDADGNPVRRTGMCRDITAAKLAEAALRKGEEALRLSEERHALALEVAEEGHLDWNLQTDEFFASDQARRVMNVPPDTEGRTRDDVMGRVPYHPEDAVRVSAAWRESLAGRGAEHEIGYRILRDAEPRWILARWKIFRDAHGKPQRVIGVVSDMTERKRVLETLRESEARFRTLVELNSSGFWEQDEDLRYIPSSFAVDIGGYATDERVGKTRWELSGGPMPLSGSWVEHQADLAARRAFRDFEYRRMRPDGRIGYYSASGAPIFDDRGRFRGYYGVANDITQRKRIEEELRRAQRLESMGTLAGGIAHDFNNILGAILGYGEMAMRNAKEGTRLRRDLDSILAAGERGRSLVDRILAFSRSSVGERVPVHVQAVVREALDQVAASLPGNVSIVPRLRAGRAAMLGDSTQVHQVVMNLASNAVQAMPQGGVLRVSLDISRNEAPRAALVGTAAPGEQIVLKVADSGTGIRPEVLERMFDPFFTTKEVGVGTGLGLSLVHGIVVNLGGAIDVTTGLGKGTTFTVYLPRTGDAPAKVADESRPLPRGDGERVLVIDDEEPLVRLATETLESLGYASVGFTSSVDALAEFGAHPGRFDAILTDERMPGVTGSAIIRAVRRINPAIPILLMTGFAGGAAAKARELGANEVLKKPLLARELATSLARVLHPMCRLT